jgi:23S rRNA (uracil1939-C5)-methyltransferase
MPIPLQPGDRITIHLDSLAAGGETVGRHEGMAVFVMWGCPGDEADVEITEVSDRFARGIVHRVITPSPDRVTAPCPHFGYCGGCQIQHIAYPAQLRHKTQIVRDAVSRIAGLASAEIADTWGMDDPWRYRNRAEYHAGADESGAFCLGFTRVHTHDVFPLRECALQHPISERIRTTLLDLVRCPTQGPPAVIAREAGGRQSPDDRGNLAVSDGPSGFPIPRPDDPAASLLALEVLISFHSSQAIAALVCDGRPDFLQALSEALVQRVPGLIGVSAARARGRLAAHRSPSESIVGKTHITERLGDAAYRISPDAFFQANPQQAARMLDLVKQWVFADRVDGVLDLYSGVGTFLLPLARRAHHAVAVEENDAALADLRASVRQWRLDNVNYYQGKVERVLPRLAQRGWKTDVIVIDPPRKGAGPAICAAAAKLGPRRIILVSCHPATLARDLKSLTEHGYLPRRIQPIDMFPQTHHVEAVALCETK